MTAGVCCQTSIKEVSSELKARKVQVYPSEYIRKVQVYPPEIKGRDAVLRALKKAVEKENEAHPEETAYYLPETLNGETVTWSKVPDLTGLELTLN